MERYWIYAIVAVLLAVCGYVAFAEGYQDKVYRIIYRLVCAAEREIVGTKRGQERKAQVINTLHGILPRWARIFVSEADINELIELAVAGMKALLENQTGGSGCELPEEKEEVK